MRIHFLWKMCRNGGGGGGELGADSSRELALSVESCEFLLARNLLLPGISDRSLKEIYVYAAHPSPPPQPSLCLTFDQPRPHRSAESLGSASKAATIY